MINYPKILVMTTAEYEAQKNSIENTTLVRLTDNSNSPLAVGDSLLDGGSEPTFDQTFLTATDETGTLTNSIDIGSLGANGTKNLLSYEITTGTAEFSDVLIPETAGILFNDSGTLGFTDTITLEKLDVTTTEVDGVSYTTDVFTVTAGTNVLTVDETEVDITTAALSVTTTGVTGVEYTTDTFTVTAGTNVLTVDETEVDINTASLSVTTTGVTGVEYTTDTFTVTAGTNVLTVDETEVDVTTASLVVTTTGVTGTAFTTDTFTVTAGTNVLTVDETETELTTPSLVVTVSGATGIDFTADVFKVTAGTNILTVDETDFKLEGLASGVGTALVLDGSSNILLDSSSSRYKHDIKDLDIDSSKIYDLKPKSFKFNVTNMDSFGLIAEEVNETIPELVVKNKKNEIESVMYNRLPILLLCELKKLRAELDEIKNKL